VSSCLAVQDMAAVPAVLAAVRRVLKPGGRMVFSIPHPCTDTPERSWERDRLGRKRALKLAGYFEGGASTCHWNMARLAQHWDTPCWRYTLSEWSSFIADAGLRIRRMTEPRPTAEQVRRIPELEGSFRMPFFLIFDVER
jgi:hypothetical protein